MRQVGRVGVFIGMGDGHGPVGAKASATFLNSTLRGNKISSC